jgi:quinol monooxygenase YgiN
MIGVIATIRTQDGKGEEFEAVFRELSAKVRANEPGNKLYQLAKSRTEPNTYKVMEIYADDAALAAHRETEHFRDLGRKMGAAMAGRPDVELLDTCD